MTNGGAMRARRKSRRWLGLAIVLAVCVVGGAGYVMYRARAAQRATAASQDAWELVPVQRGSIILEVTASGTAQPELTYEVGPKLSGTVARVLVQVGDIVKQGQELVRLDDTDFVFRVQEARDNLAVAEANLAKAKLQAEVAPTEKRLQVEQARTNLLNAEAKLAQLKETATSEEVDQARVSVNQAQLSVDSAQKDYERTKALFEQGAVTRQQLDSAENKYLTAVESLKAAQQKLDSLLAGPDPRDLAAAEAAVEQARTSLRVAEANAEAADAEQQVLTAQAQVVQARNALRAAERDLALTRVTAPIAGTIIDLPAQAGQVVGQSTVLAVLADLGRMEILANVDETDVHSVRTGQEVTITADSVPGRTFKGTVKSVGEQGKATGGVIYFPVRIRVEDGTDVLKAGMTADVNIIVDKRVDVPVIPNAALEERRGQLMARTLDENKRPLFKRVQLGLTDGTITEVISGLELGEQVAVRRSSGTASSDSRQTVRGGMGIMSFMGGGPGRIP